MIKRSNTITWSHPKTNKQKFMVIPILLFVVIFSWLWTVHWQCETEREDIKICDNSNNCFTLMDRNLWAKSNDISTPESWWCTYQRWNNTWFPIWCKTDNCVDEVTENVTTTLATRNNKYNDIGYNEWKNFIIKSPDYRSDKSHDWIRGWITDNEENERWEILSEIDDVYDVDIFRQWPCPKWYHVPNLWERIHVLKLIDNDLSKINLNNISTYRNYENGNINIWEWANYRTSSPISNSQKAKAISEKWFIEEIDRSMWLHVRCFKNKRDAMVLVWTWISDIVFFDTQVPNISKVKWEYLTLLNYTGNTATFKQQLKISEKIKKGTDKSYLFLQACQDLRNSYLNLSWINTDLEIKCILDYNIFQPWRENILNIYVIWDADISKKKINDCSMLSRTDDGNTIHLNIEQNFVQDFSINKNVYTEIVSDFIYAPTRNIDWIFMRNYIYTWQHSLSTRIDWDKIVVTDEDLLHGWDISLLSAEPLAENDIQCTIVEWPEWLDINPLCKITHKSITDIKMWSIHSCWSIECEDPNCAEWNKCWRNNPNKYKTIRAPFRYSNTLHISATTWNTYYLKSWDVRTIKISLKDSRGCYNRNDGTNSTYVQIKFKKIISPYKAWYLSWEDGWVRYTSKNLWTALKSWGKDIWFSRYISNPQSAKSWGYSWWVIDKINYEIRFNTWVTDENYHVQWNATIWSYNKQIIITKPTFNDANPEWYKFIFPTY